MCTWAILIGVVNLICRLSGVNWDNMTSFQWRIQGEGRGGLDPPIRPEEFFAFSIIHSNSDPGSTKIHFSEPEISKKKKFWGRPASKHSLPCLLVITQYYCLLHIFGKNPGTPPIKNSWIHPWVRHPFTVKPGQVSLSSRGRKKGGLYKLQAPKELGACSPRN